MILGIPIWDDRISPVLDVAGTMIVVEGRDGREIARSTIRFSVDGIGSRAQAMSDLGIGLVVCAGASAQMVHLLEGLGVQVCAGIAGPVEPIVSAVIADGVVPPGHQMPGCGRRGARRGMRSCESGRHHRGGGNPPEDGLNRGQHGC